VIENLEVVLDHQSSLLVVAVHLLPIRGVHPHLQISTDQELQITAGR